MEEQMMMTHLMALRSNMVNTKIVKQQGRSLWAEEQSLEAGHVYQTGIQHMSYLVIAKFITATTKKMISLHLLLLTQRRIQIRIRR